MSGLPRWLRYSMIIGTTLGVIALFGLVISSADAKVFDRYFTILLLLNVGMTCILAVVVVTLIIRLIRRFQKKTFGTRMTARLAFTSACIAFIPTFTIYLLSTEIVGRNIDSWFDQRVEGALESGVTITRGVLQIFQKRTDQDAKRIADALSKTPPTLILPELLKQVDSKPGLEAVVFTPNGTAVASAGPKINALLPDMPTSMQIQAAQATGSYNSIDGASFDPSDTTKPESLKVRVIVRIPVLESNAELIDAGNPFSLASHPKRQPLFLQLMYPIPEDITKNAAHLTEGYREYQTMMLSRESLQHLYKLTLTLTLLLTVFASMTASLSFAKRTTEPVLQLARGTRQLAGGEFAPIKEFSGNSEINELTRSFNMMIKQLKEARTSIELQRKKAEEAQLFLTKVLTSISSGVLVLDSKGMILSMNESAQKILSKYNLSEGTTLANYDPVLAEILASKRNNLNDINDSFIVEYEIENADKNTPLYIHGTPMTIENEICIVLVFDDLTQLIRAQRATAWGEVARRLAHEIKNPLTPIRLSAERLEWKLGKKITDPDDLNLLHRTTSTITMQVDALTQMVNDFREYAKLPETKLRPLNLNEFLEKTIDLYLHAGTNVVLALDHQIPLVLGDSARLRQVIHNLISNSIEAAEDQKSIRITIKTKPVFGIDKPEKPHAVKLSIMDNGPGFGKKVLASAFEPYVTTKPTGSGLGLPMVKKILDEHEATINLQNIKNSETQEIMGAQVVIILKAAKEVGHPTSRERL